MEKETWVITIDDKQFSVSRHALDANIFVVKQVGGTFNIILANHSIEDKIEGVTNIRIDAVFLKKLVNGLSSMLQNYEKMYGEIKMSEQEGALPSHSENKSNKWN